VKTLIVDDDKLCRVLLENMLSPYSACDTACDGAEAIDAFRLALDNDAPYDLVCLDIMMPGMNGHQVLESIREIERNRDILGNDGVKVVMATALDNSKQCIQAFREGCESYLTKPIDAGRLLAAVRSVVGALPEARSTRTDTLPSRAAGPAEGGHLGRFLVVDDDRVCRELLAEMLDSFGRCDFALDGAEAVEAVRLALEDDRPYDLVCLDIMMPGMNGHDALTAIRQVEQQHGIVGCDGVKVIMTTALSDSKHCLQAFREGCESYVTKPIHEGQLFERLRQLQLPCGQP
jgi:two-component system chemotaxis response regulator CheY